MFELSDLCNSLLRTLISAPLAWQAPAQLALRLGLGLDATADALADLDEGGWIEGWELGDIVYVTLSPRGAERLQVRLIMIGRSDGMRWASINEPEPEPPRASGRHEGLSSASLMADPAPGPDAAAEASERMTKLCAAKAAAGDAAWIDLLPRPRLLLGSELTPWPGPTQNSSNACAGCGSKPIPAAAYCLVCDRWGLDHHLTTRPVRPGGRPFRPTGPAHRHDPAAARNARRAKHKRALAAKIQGEKAKTMNPDKNGGQPRRTAKGAN